MFELINNYWQDLSTAGQDAIVFVSYLLPVVLFCGILLFRLRPQAMVTALLKRYKKINVLIVVILAVCLSASVAIQASSSAYKMAMAKVANRFELVITAPGSKTDMMLATVYLRPTPTPLLQGDIYQQVANDPNVDVVAPIAYGDSYAGYPIVGSTNSFIKHLSNNSIKGSLFTQTHQAIIGAGVQLNIGDSFIPQHGVHKSFSPKLTQIRPQRQAIPKSKVAQEIQRHSSAKQQLFSKKDGDNYYCPTLPINEGDEGGILSTSKKYHNQFDELLNQKLPANRTIETKKQADPHQASVTVVGKMPITHSPWDKAIITPVESVWSLHGLPTGHAPHDSHLGEPFNMTYFAGTPAILVHPHKPFQAYALSNKYNTKTAMAFRPPTILSKLNAQLDDMTDLLIRIVFVAMGLVLSLALVAIALLSKLFEKHFQLLIALGSPKRFMVAILWGYVTLLALCATVLGCLLGYAFSLILASYIEDRLSMLLNIQFGWTELMLCAIFFTLSSLLGLIPALSSFKTR